MISYTPTISKEEIALLEVEMFPGRIVVVATEEDADKAVDYLEQFHCVGFDTETRPSFKKGQRFKIALMQIATEEICFLFRLNYIDMPASLGRFLKNREVRKIGLSLRDDFQAIRKRTNVELDNFVDLQSYVPAFGIKDASLQKIYAILFQKKISKGQRLTNWEAEELSESQQKYAALDAWACLKIYQKLQETDE